MRWVNQMDRLQLDQLSSATFAGAPLLQVDLGEGSTPRKVLAQLGALVLLFLSSGFILPVEAEETSCITASRLVKQGASMPQGGREQEDTFREAAKLCPNLADAHFNLGMSLLKSKKVGDAVTSLKRAVELKEELLFVLGLANALVVKGDLDEAEKYYRRGITLAPDRAEVYQGLAVVNAERGDLAGAEASLRQGIQLNAKDGSLFYDLGLVLERTGKVDEAIVSLQTAIEKQEGYAAAEIALGRLLLQKGDLAQAERWIGKGVMLEPENNQALLLLASVYDREKNLSGARDILRKALLLNDKDVTASVNLAVVLYKMGQRPEGLARLRQEQSRVAETKPSAVQQSFLNSALGWALIQEKQLDEAEQFLNSALALDGNNSFAHNNLGVLFQLKGEKAKAKEHYARAHELHPGLLMAEQNLAQMD